MRVQGGNLMLSGHRSRSILRLLRERRSIRVFKPVSIPEEVVELIIEAGKRAPTYLQLYSVIWVRDEEKRRELLEQIVSAKAEKQETAIEVGHVTCS